MGNPQFVASGVMDGWFCMSPSMQLVSEVRVILWDSSLRL